MNEQTLQNYGITTLRVSLGIILIAHSLWLKLIVFTLPGTASFFESIGLPGFVAYVVFLIEAMTGIALVLGVESRWAALLAAPVLAGATWAHAANGWLFTNAGGGWEYPLLLTVATLAQALLGDGALALRRSSKLGVIQATRSEAFS
ncbi:DoxX family protein [Marinobacter halodurans]|uniref:DoxX family protein n=1 Tax=Marinobacter halodurans TaxID=2528979 RepID=A0ABY1ZIP7_9GAMM|nr:DoxX family protein [Marinobacter halodurans]TBW54594.1 DoxX family protein [Marinobacter halodurans]